MKNWGNWRIVGCVLISLLMVSFFGMQSVKAADYTIKEVNIRGGQNRWSSSDGKGHISF